MKETTRAAIARIDVIRDGDSVSRGTGFLVSEEIVLTALHVIADRKTKPPQFFTGRIRLRFPGRDDIYATPVDEMWDPDFDWVLLRCDRSLGVQAIALAELTQDGVEWETFEAGTAGLTPRNTDLRLAIWTIAPTAIIPWL